VVKIAFCVYVLDLDVRSDIRTFNIRDVLIMVLCIETSGSLLDSSYVSDETW
jgi:hypothetical protein